MKEFAIALLLISGVIKVQLQIMAPGVPDPTLVAIVFLVAISFFNIKTIFLLKRSGVELIGGAFFLAFSAVILFSFIYANNNVALLKLLKFALVFFVFFITLLNSNLDLNKVGFFYIIFSLISAVLFLIIYPKFRLGLLGQEADVLKRSYLAFADSCVISLILLFTVNSLMRFKLLIVAILVFSLLLSGARAPLLFLLLLASISFSIKGVLFIIKNKTYSSTRFISYLILCSIVFVTLGVNTDFSKVQQSDFAKTLELSAERFKLLFSENKGSSVNVRVQHIDSSFYEIEQQPFIGVGLGGYSKHALKVDKYDYPHNLFLELWVEKGVVAFFLFAAFLFITFYAVSFQNFSPPILLIISYCFLNAQKSLSYADNRVMIFWCAVALISSRLKFTEYRN